MSGRRIRPVTSVSLFTMGVDEIIGSLAHYTMGDIPEGIKDAGDLKQIEYFLGRLGNDYAYMMELLSYSRNYVRRLKRAGEKERYEDMIDVRDGLESIGSAVKLKYSAVSRLLTSYEQVNDEKNMSPYRMERREVHD